MGDLAPPDPPLRGAQVALRPFRVGDAAAIGGLAASPASQPDVVMWSRLVDDQFIGSS